MTSIGVVTSHATSLRVVGESIAYALRKLGHESRLYLRQVFWEEARKEFERGIIFIPFDPIYLPSWVLLQRDYNLCGIPTVTYVTVEGRPKKWLIPEWIKRDGAFVANSNYTAKMLNEVGVYVMDVIPHGLNFEEIEAASPNRQFKKRIKARVIFGTVASDQYRKGLDKLAEAIKVFSEKHKDAKFFVLTTPKGTEYFTSLENAYVHQGFGNLTRQEVLSLIATFDYYLCSSYSEGFCLPVLEAQALGVPCIFPEYEPLTEITHPSANFPFKIMGEKFVDYGYGIRFQMHDYDVQDMVEQMEIAYDIYTCKKEEYKERSNRVKEFAKQFDAVKVYARFVR